MLIIRSGKYPQEPRRLNFDLQRLMRSSNSRRNRGEYLRLPVEAVIRTAIAYEIMCVETRDSRQSPYLRDQSSRPRGRGRQHASRVCSPETGADQTLLPLHLSFCRTTLKKDVSGNEASGRVFLALRTVTIDSRSTWIGLRPSSVRYTG